MSLEHFNNYVRGSQILSCDCWYIVDHIQFKSQIRPLKSLILGLGLSQKYLGVFVISGGVVWNSLSELYIAVKLNIFIHYFNFLAFQNDRRRVGGE